MSATDVKVGLSRRIGQYFDSYWIPLSIAITISVLWCALLFVAALKPWAVLSGAFVLLFWAMMLVAGVWNLWRRRWGKGLVNVLLPIATGAISLFVAVAIFLGDERDDFADHLTIPSDIELSEPLPMVMDARPAQVDAFQQALMSALAGNGSDDAALKVDAPSLARLQRQHPELLIRYLAASSAWHLASEGDSLQATRRFMVDDDWQLSLNGYYSNLFASSSGASTPQYQSRVLLRLNVDESAKQRVTLLRPNVVAVVPTVVGNELYESTVALVLGKLVVEVFEQSTAKERRLTRAVFAQLEMEFAPLAADPTWGKAHELLMASSSIQASEPSLTLRSSFQPGIYHVVVHANPGEPGYVYLKAFEVTQGTPLSAGRLKERCGEWIGWSSDAREQFLVNCEATIYEGDWGQPYAARFEAWFAPQSGAPERELLERNFKIEGWQR